MRNLLIFAIAVVALISSCTSMDSKYNNQLIDLFNETIETTLMNGNQDTLVKVSGTRFVKEGEEDFVGLEIQGLIGMALVYTGIFEMKNGDWDVLTIEEMEARFTADEIREYNPLSIKDKIWVNKAHKLTVKTE